MSDKKNLDISKISLPKGGGAVAGIGETFQPNAFTGTASLSIPIHTSSCRDFEPQLSVEYSSGSGNGIFGIGFSLAIPSISRKTEKGFPHYDDRDTFLISNADDLIPSLAQNEKGEWIREASSPPNIDSNYSITRFRPRTEGLFARIEQWVDLTDGDTHWRIISKDNVTSIYGETEDARIVDPENNYRIFQWLIERTYDAKGNQIVYKYQAGQANKYIRRIKYGNYTPGTKTDSDDWHFEVDFEYSKPSNLESLPIDEKTAVDTDMPRPDPFSSYKSGFDIRTVRRCIRISMSHRFKEVAEGKLFPVSATEFSYKTLSAMTFLKAVKHVGYREGTAKAMPPLMFTWSRCRLDEMVTASPENLSFKPLTMEAGRSIPGLLETGARHMVDLYGEGLPGILYTDADSVFYSCPKGEGVYSQGEAPHAFPIERNLQDGQYALMDLEGDGKLDLVVTSPSRAGYYASRPNGNWDPFRSFATIPTELHHPQKQMVDVTGDGTADLLLFEEDAVKVYPSKGKLGYDALQKQFAQNRLPFSSHPSEREAVHFADMFGDGGSHLVRIRNGCVECWPSLGYGRFGAKIEIANAPCFGREMDASRLFITDVDGSGTTDLVYVYLTHVDIYPNESGNRFGDPISIPLPGVWNEISQISFVDVLGNGTASLVLTSLNSDNGFDHQYCDFTGGIKPHLLTGTDNNLGASTRIRYSPSTRFYLADEKAGMPWITRLPFPVQVVDQTETIDHIGGARLVASFTYHHGYFDPVEREFRGFGRVERTDAESFDLFSGLEKQQQVSGQANDGIQHVPPVLTKTWYHTGAYDETGVIAQQFASEYYASDDQTHQLPSTVLNHAFENENNEHVIAAHRAMHGQVLREEVYGLDHKQNPDLNPPNLNVHPYSVTQSSFGVRLIQPKLEQKDAVCFVHPSESLTWHYDRNPADPRISHALTLDVDNFGNVLQQSTISYGRRKDASDTVFLSTDREKQRLVHIVCIENSYTQAIIDKAGLYRGPLPSESCTYELRKAQQEISNNGVTVLYRPDTVLSYVMQAADGMHDVDYEDLHFDKAKRAAAKDAEEGSKYFRRLIERVRTLYRKDDLTALLPLGMIESLALPGESYRLAFTRGLLEHTFRNKQGELLDYASFLEGKGEDQGGYIALDGGWWIPSGTAQFDPGADVETPANTAVHELETARQHFYLPRKFVDPFGVKTVVTYDDYDLLITETVDALDNVVKSDNDYRVLQPRMVIDPNGNRAAVAFDALGMVVATAVMGKESETVGDLLEGFDADISLADLQAFIAEPQTKVASLLGKATTRIVYDLERYHRTGQPPFVATLVRETHWQDIGGDKAKIQIGFAYSDGFGREIQTKSQAEAGDAPQRNTSAQLKTGDISLGDLLHDQGELTQAHTQQRWIGSGRTVFNNKGNPVKQYEPFYSSTQLFEEESEMTMTGVTPVLFYDPLGRVVATLHPNHTFEKVVFDCWQQETWDVNDTVVASGKQTGDPRTDPDLAGYTREYFKTQPEGWQTWHAQRMEKAVGDPARDAARKAAAHAGTPTVTYVDTLGRPFLKVADNGTDPANKPQLFATRVMLDIEGNHRELMDTNDRVAMRYSYDMLGNRIHEVSMDAGERWMLNDVTGNPIRAWDSRGHNFVTAYDVLRRPIKQYVRGTLSGSDPRTLNRNILVDKIEYGESQTNAEVLNLRTRVYRHSDSSGVITNAKLDEDDKPTEAYDFKGNLLRNRRQLAKDYVGVPDWQIAPELEAESFVSASRYDALNRTIQVIAPHSDRTDSTIPLTMNIIRPEYNEANLLERVDIWLQQKEESKDVLLSSSASPHGVTNIDYDAKGQRTRITYGNGAETRYQYDRDTFQLVQLYTRRGEVFTGDCENPDSQTGYMPAPAVPPVDTTCGLQNLHYTYDPMGNITHIRDDAQPTLYFNNQRVEPINDYRYDAIYRLVGAKGREHLGQTNGSRNTPVNSEALKEYHSGLPQPGNGSAMGSYLESYIYDSEGNFLSMLHRGTDPEHSGWTRSYAYQEPSLTEASRTSNRLSSTTVGGTPTAYSYDAHGNINSMPHLSRMQWDYRDQLQQSARQVTKDGSATETTWYVYDASGQRVRQITESYAGEGKTAVRRKERLYLGGFEIYRSYKNDGDTVELERETLHVMDDKERVAMVETRTHGGSKASKQSIRYQLGNHLGSASLELDDQARIISYEEYTPFGSTAYQAVASQIDTAKRYRYSGKERDDSTGLYYYGARYYAPWLGRWMSPDPAGTVDGLNLYAFVRGNPITFADHHGLWSIFGKNHKIAPSPVADESPPAAVASASLHEGLLARGAQAIGQAAQSVGQSIDDNPSTVASVESGTAAVAQIGTSVVNAGLSNTARILPGSANVIGTALSTTIAAPVGAVGAGRAARQGYRAQKRLGKIDGFIESLSQDQDAHEHSGEVHEIAHFVKAKTTRRVRKMGVQAGCSTIASTAGIVALAGGVVTPVGIAGLATAAGAGALGALHSGYYVAKGVGKIIGRAANRMGNERETHATKLYELATGDSEPAIKLLEAMHVTKKMSIAKMRRVKKGEAINYIKQKMRS